MSTAGRASDNFRTAWRFHPPFALKLVSVAFAAFGLVLPTLSLTFWKSFFFSFFFLALEPILSVNRYRYVWCRFVLDALLA